jgi:hypothetical protein
MVCKKNTGDLYWFGPKNVLRPVGDERSVLSCTEVLVVGITSESERGRGSQVSGRGRHYRGMVSVLLVLLLHGEACVPLLRKWFLSFGIVAVRPVIPGPVASMAFRSLQFDLAWRAEASGAGNAARSRSDHGNSGLEQSFRTLYTHESCI